MGFAVHSMPQIGEVWRGVWLATAFGGQGLNTSAMAGALIARAIVEGDDAWKRFLPFELVWAGGYAGRTVARASAWWQRQSEAVVALAARQHEEFQRSKAEKPDAAKLPGAKLPNVQLPIPSRDVAMPALKRVLKGSLTADDQPIDAPETVPAADAGGTTEQASRLRDD
jgi:hypothetical protein